MEDEQFSLLWRRPIHPRLVEIRNTSFLLKKVCYYEMIQSVEVVSNIQRNYHYPKYVPAHNPTSLACLCANRLTSDHDVTRLLYASASCAQPLRSQTVYNL